MNTTPVEFRDGVWFKRDDYFTVAGVCGGKARTCWTLAQGARGLVTAGSRSSPQVNIVAQIAKHLKVPCRVHTPTGSLSPEVQAAVDAGAELVQHPAGYNNVIIARAREDAWKRGWTNIPFGMTCLEAVRQTAAQVVNIPEGVKRLVVPVGSGMSLAGILTGLQKEKRKIPILAVSVGAGPEKRLNTFAPYGWQVRVEIIISGLAYHTPSKETDLCGVQLDSIYEAKCIPFIRPGDLLWIVGIRQTARVKKESDERV